MAAPRPLAPSVCSGIKPRVFTNILCETMRLWRYQGIRLFILIDGLMDNDEAIDAAIRRMGRSDPDAVIRRISLQRDERVRARVAQRFPGKEVGRAESCIFRSRQPSTQHWCGTPPRQQQRLSIRKNSGSGKKGGATRSSSASSSLPHRRAQSPPLRRGIWETTVRIYFRIDRRDHTAASGRVHYRDRGSTNRSPVVAARRTPPYESTKPCFSIILPKRPSATV